MSDRIRRTFDFTVTRADDADDALGGLTLEGYAAVFNQWTEIHGEFSGPFMERIAPGAFAKTLENRMPVLQFDHGTHPLVGSIPIGVPTTLREDELGLFVKARLSDNWLIQPVRDAIKDGAIRGMSFRFAVPKDKDDWGKDGDTRQRTIREAVLYELGPVVFPAYAGTSVGVRSELVSALTDESVRSDLARILTFGQMADQIPDESEADPVTSDEAPAEPQPALAGRTKEDEHKASTVAANLRHAISRHLSSAA
jgi:hypothetical protein